MNRIIVGAFSVALAIFSFSGVQAEGRNAKDAGMKKIYIVTTLFPLYDMAKHIGGERADVSLLLPPGMEAHSFEPRPSDILRINEADIFVYTGKFMEPWAEDVINGARNKKLIAVDTSRGTRMIPEFSHEKGEPEESPDPHIWLDFDNVKIMTMNILHAIEARDPANKNLYEQNAQEYEAKLAEMDSAYRSALTDCRSKEIVYGGHYAFGYLAHRYGLRYIAAQGVSPDAEPTARDLVRLVDQIRRDRIKYIFFEELSSPKIAETIAGETGAKMLLLNAAHNVSRDQFERGLSFFDILSTDLKNLKIGLGCK